MLSVQMHFSLVFLAPCCKCFFTVGLGDLIQKKKLCVEFLSITYAVK